MTYFGPGRHIHTNIFQCWQTSIQSQSWPYSQASKCQLCAGEETVVSLVLSDGQRPKTCISRMTLGASPFTRRHVRKSRSIAEAERLKLMERLCFLSHAGENVRPSDSQNQSLQPLEDESDPIPPRDPPREHDRIEEAIAGGEAEDFHRRRFPTCRHLKNAQDMRWTTCHTLHGVGSRVVRQGKCDGHFLKTSGDSGVKGGAACDYRFAG